MAYILPISYKGISIESYNKITGYTVREDGYFEDSTIKKYAVDVQLNTYTDASKQYDIEQTVKTVNGFLLDAINLTALYSAIKPEESLDA